MKNIGILLFYLFFAISSLAAQSESVLISYSRSADILAKGNFRYGLSSNAQYGLTDKITISAHPVWIFLAPSIEAKWNLLKEEGMAVSFFHSLSCPTPILSLISRKGVGGMISPEFDIPFMLALRNGIISTYELTPYHRLSGEFSIEVALFNSKLEPGSSIDLPIISPRNAVYYNNFGMDMALSGEGKIAGNFGYYAKAEVFLFPIEDEAYRHEYGKTNRYFGELTGLAFWNTSKRFKFGLGGRITLGDYPFGTQWHLLPKFDFVKYIR